MPSGDSWARLGQNATFNTWASDMLPGRRRVSRGTGRGGEGDTQPLLPREGGSHHHALALELLFPFLLLALFPVDLEAHGPALLQVEQLLEELLHVEVELGRGLHEGALPLAGQHLGLAALHFAVGALVTLVPHQHDGDALHVPFDLADLFIDGLELLQRLPAGDGVHQDEGVPFGDGEPLHGRELVAARGVRDLQSADALVTADDLPVRVFHGGDVALPKRAFHKPQDERALANTTCAEHGHPVIIALLRHVACRLRRLTRKHLPKEPGV